MLTDNDTEEEPSNLLRDLVLDVNLQINEINLEEKNNWVPPSTHGLNNCNVIIPQYYNLHKNPRKIFTINYFEMIIDDIRNFRKLDKYKLEYIKKLSHEHKNKIIDIFNDSLDEISEIL